MDLIASCQLSLSLSFIPSVVIRKTWVIHQRIRLDIQEKNHNHLSFLLITQPRFPVGIQESLQLLPLLSMQSLENQLLMLFHVRVTWNDS